MDADEFDEAVFQFKKATELSQVQLDWKCFLVVFFSVCSSSSINDIEYGGRTCDSDSSSDNGLLWLW